MSADIELLRAFSGRKRNLFGHVVEELGRRIIRGDLKPGDTLPNEGVLGRDLRASRSVVREAVKSLAAKGLLEPRARTGTQVRHPIHWNVLDLDVLSWRYAAMPRAQFYRELFELRRMIEPPAAGLAAQRALPTDVAELEAACRAMEGADETTDTAIEADLRFHRAVLAASHNDLLLQMAGLIGVGLLISFRISPSSFHRFVPVHRRAFESIRDRRPAAARDAMAELLSRTEQFMEGELASGAPVQDIDGTARAT